MPILEREPSLFPHDLLEGTLAESASRRWWAFYTKARQEKAFARQLHLLEVPFYLPLVPKNNQIRGRRVRSYVPLFGGYCFVFGTDEERVRGLTTNRVSTVLPVTDQQQLWHDLQQVERLIAAEAPLTLEARLQKGDRVRVRKGPFAGVEGIIEQRRSVARLIVYVQLLQQGVSVAIDDFMVERI
jgi:transcription termination/antitermination protein NusG